MYVCLCRGITVAEIQEAIASGARSVELVRDATGAGSGCGGCISSVESLVDAGVGRVLAVRRLVVLDDGVGRRGANAA